MSELGRYLLVIIMTAFSCELLQKLISSNSSVGKTVKLVSRVVILCAVLAPIVPKLGGEMMMYIPEFSDAASVLAQEGDEYAQKEMMAIIKSRCTSYIFDKAQSLGLSVEIDLELSEIAPHTPLRICISGRASPYAKNRLMQIIENELGIQREDQIWTES